MAEPARSFASAIEESPLGPVLLVTSQRGLCLLQFMDGQSPEDARMEASALLGVPVIEDDHPAIKRAWRQILAYLEGRRKRFSIPLDLRGTRIQRQVWATLRSIPYGDTVSYSALAGHMGMPAGTQSIARACARNPVLLAVPCHRVITADGHLGGYRADISAKHWLLTLEGNALASPVRAALPPAREPDASHGASPDRVLHLLPDPITRWLLARSTGRLAAEETPPEVWLERALDETPPHLHGNLADLLAEHGVAGRDQILQDLAGEVLAIVALSPAGPASSRIAAMRAAARMGSGWFPVLGRRLLRPPTTPGASWRAELEGLFNTILRGLLPCPPGVIEWSADLLLALGGPPTGTSGPRLDAQAAIAQAERGLAQGIGDRLATLRSLVRLYRDEGDLLMARHHQLSLALESNEATDQDLLQSLIDGALE